MTVMFNGAKQLKLYLVQELKDQVELLVCVDNIKQLANHSLYQFHAMKCNVRVLVHCPVSTLSAAKHLCCRDHLNNARMLELFQKRDLSGKQSTCLIDLAKHLVQPVIATIIISHI